MSDLLKKIGDGVFWLVLSKVTLQIINMFFLIYLARLIDPSEFGKAALMIIFYSICEGFYQFIYYNILLIKKLTDKMISSALFISLVISLIIICVVFLSNYFIQANEKNNTANILGDVELYYVFFVLLTGLSVVLKGILFKKLYFKFIALSNSLASILGTGIFSLIIAKYFTPTYHAILFGFILTYLINILMALYKERIILAKFSNNHLKKISNQFVTITSNSLVNKFALNGDYIIISKFLGVENLGFYSKAYELASKPVNILGNSFQSVSLSSISKVKPDFDKIGQLVYKMTYLLSLMCLPSSIIIFLISKDVIQLVLGPKWALTGELIGILGFLIFFRIGYKKLMALIQSVEKFRLILIIQSVYAVNIMLGTYILYPKGLFFISLWVVISCCINYIICLFVVKKIFKIDLVRVLIELMPGVIFMLIIFFINMLIFDLIGNIYYSLIISFITGIIIFLLLEKLFPDHFNLLQIKTYLTNED